MPLLEEGFIFFLPLFARMGALFCPPVALWARVCGNMCHREGWLSHQNWTLLWHPCTRFARKDPFASLFVGFWPWRVIDSALVSTVESHNEFSSKSSTRSVSLAKKLQLPRVRSLVDIVEHHWDDVVFLEVSNQVLGFPLNEISYTQS